MSSADESSSDQEDRNFWEASETEKESFSNAEGADENGKWEVEIIGEEVDGRGKVRYEADWKGWKRADGTNTTWDIDLLHPDDITLWKRKQTVQRNKLAEESLDIDIWATTDIHNTATRLRLQAYEEKLRIRSQQPIQYRQQMEKLLAKRRGLTEETSAANPSSTRSGRQFTRDNSVSTSASHAESSRASGSFTTRNRSTSKTVSESRASTSKIGGKRVALTPPTSASRALQRSATASTSEYQPTTTTSSFTSVSSFASASTSSKGKKRAIDLLSRSPSPNDGDDDDEDRGKSRSARVTQTRSQRTSPNKLSRRERLESIWTARAHASGAAGITITNKVDHEEIPPLPPKFRYLESEYLYSNKVPQIDDEAVFVRCECDRCSRAQWCSCQGLSELLDTAGRNKVFAYTPDGLFKFNVPQGAEVIECNPYCRCDRYACPNRVAQRPRDVPMEIFKTYDRGWGVQSPVDVERGKVLGIYTGLLMLRAVADMLPDEEKSYGFDLDGRESQDRGTPEDAYTVDSRTCGNWTRFINHSCYPNLAVYSVVYDTIPEMNRPYIAFVAKVDIPAGTEFTFDYDPAAAALETVETQVRGKGKEKGRPAIPEGAKPCRCGSNECRGWVRG